MNNSDYFGPAHDEDWDFFYSQWEGEDDPTNEDFEAWLEEMHERHADHLIERAENARDMEWDD